MDEQLNDVQQYAVDHNGTDTTGHGIDHLQRVVRLAKKILTNYPDVDRRLVLATCWVHDTYDEKLVEDVASSRLELKTFLACQNFNQQQISSILHIIDHMSFSKSLDEDVVLSIEGQIVQDADRLDAIGAISIGRAFYYGGHFGEVMYDPKIAPRMQMTHAQYREPGTIINHFYEKLFRLTGMLNTPAAKEIGAERQRFMEGFVEQFKREWND